MGVKNFVLSVALGLGITQVMAMKRVGDEFMASQEKRHKGNTSISLFEPVKHCDFQEFKKRILLGADVNQKKMGQPVFFHILSETDRLRKENINSVLSTNDLEQGQYSIKMNIGAVRELHQCLELLLDQETFDINCVNRQGKSAIRVLIFRNFDKIYSNSAEEVLKSMDEAFIAKDLLKKGIFLGPDNDGYTPLHYAALENDALGTERNLKITEMLIRYGVDIDCTTPEGNTALHLCCNNRRMVLLLLAFGAQFDKKNNDDEAPASISENSSVLDMLTNKEKVEKYKKDIRGIIVKNTCSDAGVQNILQLTINNQMQPVLVNAQDSYPYTRAVLEYTKDITIEDISETDYELIEEYDLESSEDPEYGDLEESDES